METFFRAQRASMVESRSVGIGAGLKLATGISSKGPEMALLLQDSHPLGTWVPTSVHWPVHQSRVARRVRNWRTSSGQIGRRTERPWQWFETSVAATAWSIPSAKYSTKLAEDGSAILAFLPKAIILPSLTIPTRATMEALWRWLTLRVRRPP